MKRIALISAIGLALLGNASADLSNKEILFAQEQNSYQNVVTIKAKNAQEFRKASITLHGELLESDFKNLTITANLSNEQLGRLRALGLRIERNDQWIEKRAEQWAQAAYAIESNKVNGAAGIPGYGCYPTVEETFSQAADLASTYSTLAQWSDVGDSWLKSQNNGGYDLSVLKITNQAITGTKPILFVHSSMHAREYTPAALNLDFAKHLLENYQSNADARWLVDHHEIHLMFQMNPDGRKHAEAGLLWRKNANTNFCSSGWAGVDLNRNFSFFWNVTNGVGSSGNTCDQTYRGPSAGSEPETQAVETYIRSLWADNRGPLDTDAAPATTSGMHIDLHSYSQLVLWPWGHTENAAPNGTALQTLGRKLARFNNYSPEQSVGLYPTDGTSDDVSYGELGIAAYTFELGTAFFQACSTYTNRIKPDNLKALVYAAKASRLPYLLGGGPEVENVMVNGATTAQVTLGESFSLTASVSDALYNNSNGTEPSQTVANARVYKDVPPWIDNTLVAAMNADDGAFDEVSENVSVDIDTTGWTEGLHQLFVEAEDSTGQVGVVSSIFVSIGTNTGPTASFSFNCNELSCDFDATSSTDPDGQISAYQWSFGDGSTGSGANITHLFSGSGNYSVSLTVTDDRNASNQTSQTVSIINESPVAQFSFICNELSCDFDATASTDSDGQINSYQWNFGDGNSSSGVNVNHIFGTAGNYTVSLTVTDNLNGTSQSSQTVSVSSTQTGGSSSSSSGAVAWLSLALLFLRRRK